MQKFFVDPFELPLTDCVSNDGRPAYSVELLLSTVRQFVERALAAQSVPVAHPAAGWIPVSERLPKPGVNVLFGYRNSLGKWRTLRGHHSPLHTVDASIWEDGADETEDGAFEPEGWWEEPVESETLNYVADDVTHWMPLPAPPAETSREEVMLVPSRAEIIADLRVLQKMPDIPVRVEHKNGRIVITTVQALLGIALAYFDAETAEKTQSE